MKAATSTRLRERTTRMTGGSRSDDRRRKWPERFSPEQWRTKPTSFPALASLCERKRIKAGKLPSSQLKNASETALLPPSSPYLYLDPSISALPLSPLPLEPAHSLPSPIFIYATRRPHRRRRRRRWLVSSAVRLPLFATFCYTPLHALIAATMRRIQPDGKTVADINRELC